MIRKRSAFLLLLLSGCKEKSFSSSFVSNILDQQFGLISSTIQTISNLNEVEYEDYNFGTKVFEQSLEKENKYIYSISSINQYEGFRIAKTYKYTN